jgi:hypothetical protein
MIEIIGTAIDGIDAAIRTVWHERQRPHAEATGSTSNRFLAASKTAPSHTFQTTIKTKTIKVGTGTQWQHLLLPCCGAKATS